MSDIPKGTMTLAQWTVEFSEQFEQPPETHVTCDECGIEYTLDDEVSEVIGLADECLFCGAKVYCL